MIGRPRNFIKTLTEETYYPGGMESGPRMAFLHLSAPSQNSASKTYHLTTPITLALGNYLRTASPAYRETVGRGRVGED